MKQALSLKKPWLRVAAAWLLPFGVFLVQWLLWQGHRVQIHMMFEGAHDSVAAPNWYTEEICCRCGRKARKGMQAWKSF